MHIVSSEADQKLFIDLGNQREREDFGLHRDLLITLAVPFRFPYLFSVIATGSVPINDGEKREDGTSTVPLHQLH